MTGLIARAAGVLWAYARPFLNRFLLALLPGVIPGTEWERPIELTLPGAILAWFGANGFAQYPFIVLTPETRYDPSVRHAELWHWCEQRQQGLILWDSAYALLEVGRRISNSPHSNHPMELLHYIDMPLQRVWPKAPIDWIGED